MFSLANRPKAIFVTIPHTSPRTSEEEPGGRLFIWNRISNSLDQCQGLHVYLIKNLGQVSLKPSWLHTPKMGPANSQHCATLGMLSPGPTGFRDNIPDVLFWFLQILSRAKLGVKENGREGLLSRLPLPLHSPPSHRARTAAGGGGWRLQ